MSTKYYAIIDGEQKGPFSLEELPGAGVRPSTYIWCKGMSDWQKAEDDADVCRLFRNHLYDLMHPNVVPSVGFQDDLEKYKVQPDTPSGNKPRSRFDAFLKDTGESLPTIEEIEANKDTSAPPVSMIGYAWIVTFLCCPPTGIAALVYAYKSKKAWKEGNNNLAHEFCRSAKMWTGISFFLGLIGYGFLLAFV